MDGDSDDIETMLDELVMKPKEIVGVSCSDSIWMYKVQFFESTLSPKFYDRLRICGLPASSFAASCVSTEGNNYRVK